MTLEQTARERELRTRFIAAHSAMVNDDILDSAKTRQLHERYAIAAEEYKLFDEEVESQK